MVILSILSMVSDYWNPRKAEIGDQINTTMATTSHQNASVREY